LKITNVYVERTFNLGNYESSKIGFEAVLSESDKPLEVTADLEMLCHQHYENQIQKQNKEMAATPTANNTKAPSQTTTAQAPPPAQPKPQDNDLEYRTENGTVIISMKHRLSNERFKEVMVKVKNDGGKYVLATNNTPGHREVPVKA
jgi:uncharacterized protein (UPF0248 family)